MTAKTTIVELTERERAIANLAVWRFMNHARESADYYAQVKGTESKNVALYLKDADDAEELLKKLEGKP